MKFKELQALLDSFDDSSLEEKINKDTSSLKMSMAQKARLNRKGFPMPEEHKAMLIALSKGRKHSEETRAKMSASRSSVATKPHSEETKAKISAAAIGRKHSEETRANMSATRKGRIPSNKGKSVSEEVRAKMSAANKGRIAWNKGKSVSEEVRAKISAANKGKPMSEETKAKISAANKGKPKFKSAIKVFAEE